MADLRVYRYAFEMFHIAFTLLASENRNFMVKPMNMERSFFYLICYCFFPS